MLGKGHGLLAVRETHAGGSQFQLRIKMQTEISVEFEFVLASLRHSHKSTDCHRIECSQGVEIIL